MSVFILFNFKVNNKAKCKKFVEGSEWRYCFSKHPKSGKPTGRVFPSKSVITAVLTPLLIAGDVVASLKS